MRRRLASEAAAEAAAAATPSWALRLPCRSRPRRRLRCFAHRARPRLSREMAHPAKMAQRLLFDPHGPSEFRVNGPLSNMPEFYDVFEVRPGDGMWRHPDDRVDIW